MWEQRWLNWSKWKTTYVSSMSTTPWCFYLYVIQLLHLWSTCQRAISRARVEICASVDFSLTLRFSLIITLFSPNSLHLDIFCHIVIIHSKKVRSLSLLFSLTEHNAEVKSSRFFRDKDSPYTLINYTVV